MRRIRNTAWVRFVGSQVKCLVNRAGLLAIWKPLSCLLLPVAFAVQGCTPDSDSSGTEPYSVESLVALESELHPAMPLTVESEAHAPPKVQGSFAGVDRLHEGVRIDALERGLWLANIWGEAGNHRVLVRGTSEVGGVRGSVLFEFDRTVLLKDREETNGDTIGTAFYGGGGFRIGQKAYWKFGVGSRMGATVLAVGPRAGGEEHSWLCSKGLYEWVSGSGVRPVQLDCSQVAITPNVGGSFLLEFDNELDAKTRIAAVLGWKLDSESKGKLGIFFSVSGRDLFVPIIHEELTAKAASWDSMNRVEAAMKLGFGADGHAFVVGFVLAGGTLSTFSFEPDRLPARIKTVLAGNSGMRRVKLISDSANFGRKSGVDKFYLVHTDSQPIKSVGGFLNHLSAMDEGGNLTNIEMRVDLSPVRDEGPYTLPLGSPELVEVWSLDDGRVFAILAARHSGISGQKSTVIGFEGKADKLTAVFANCSDSSESCFYGYGSLLTSDNLGSLMLLSSSATSYEEGIVPLPQSGSISCALFTIDTSSPSSGKGGTGLAFEARKLLGPELFLPTVAKSLK